MVTVPVRPSGPAGTYTLAYQVISDDGDDVKGSVQFTLTTAVPGPTNTTTATTTEPPPSTTASAENTASSSDDSGGIPVWVWILVAVVVVAAGVVAALRMSRPKNPGT